jgi:hypothetical protein
VDFTPRGTQKVWLWVLRYRDGPDWNTRIFPGSQTRHEFDGGKGSPVPDQVIVSAVDRLGNESEMTTAVIAESTAKPKPALKKKRVSRD